MFKGRVLVTFAMPNLILKSNCSPGFRRYLIKVGNELLVYARWESFSAEGPVTNTCSRTRLIDSAAEDLQQLGRGHKPSHNGG